MGLVLKSSPAASVAFLEKMDPAGVARFARNGANGWSSVISTVLSSIFFRPDDVLRLAVHPVLRARDHVQEVGVERVRRRIEHPVKGEDDVVRGQDVAVVELHVGAQVEGVLEAVLGNVPLFGQAGDQFRLARPGGNGLHQPVEHVERQEVLFRRQLRVCSARIGVLGHGQGPLAAGRRLSRRCFGRCGRRRRGAGRCRGLRRCRGRRLGGRRRTRSRCGRSRLGGGRRRGCRCAARAQREQRDEEQKGQAVERCARSHERLLLGHQRRALIAKRVTATRRRSPTF